MRILKILLQNVTSLYYDVQEKPAMIAVESDAEAASYFKQFDEKKKR